jgi:hypothetical protein
MSYPPAPQYQQPAPQGPRTRPTVVTAAVWIQFATAAVLIASAIASLTTVDVVVEATMRALESDPSLSDAGTDMSTFEDFIRIGAYVGVAVYVVFAVFYVVLGLLNNRGNRPGRVLSWVLSGIALFCCGLGQLIGLGMQGMTTGSGSEQYNDEMMQAIEDATPMWAAVLNWVSLFMFIAGSLAVIILLAMPAANEFFRKDESPMGPYPYGQPYGAQPGQAPGSAGPEGQQPPGAEPPQGGASPTGHAPGAEGPEGRQPGSEEPPPGQQPPAPPQQ